jgi:hypothetical protein
MRDQKRNTRKGDAAAKDELVTVQVSKSVADLMNFLSGQHDKPGTDIMFGQLQETIEMILDDKLLEALKRTEEETIYFSPIDRVEECYQQLWKQRELINLLERYQKGRLRDAVERMTSQLQN